MLIQGFENKQSIKEEQHWQGYITVFTAREHENLKPISMMLIFKMRLWASEALQISKLYYDSREPDGGFN